MIRAATGRAIPDAPTEFDGTLEEMFRLHIASVLPDVDLVTRFHDHLVAYLALPDTLFVVRTVGGLERGRDIHVLGGRMRPSDNSPAWMVHRLLFDRVQIADGAHLATTLDTDLPCHFHQMARFRSINNAGWHVAHIFPAKDGNTNYQEWSRVELTRRFVRNLHPCNCFYVPKAEWMRHGGDVSILAFAAAVYRERYAAIWSEFLSLAAARDLGPPEIPASELRISITSSTPIRPRLSAAPRSGSGPVEYEASRLLFRRDVIEALSSQQPFRVVTRDHGTFEFTREEFERVFANILTTVSWRRDGVYHMAEPPKKALPFRVA